MPNPTALKALDRRDLGKPALLRLLADVQLSDWCRRTLYLAPGGDARAVLPSERWPMAELTEAVADSDTGMALFLGDGKAVAVAPPFPLAGALEVDGAHVQPLVDLLNERPLIGVVLLRLGRFAVGALRGESLIASKTDSRYVKRRHRAGGSSQRRFERSRERLVRELFDKACEVARDVLSPYEKDLRYVLLGGERHTLRRFVERCPYMAGLAPKTLGRRLNVDRPGQAALEGIAAEVWRSRVVTFGWEAGQPRADSA